MRILLIEDDLLLGDGVKTGLSQTGFTVDWLKDGHNALSILKTEHFDVVLLDINLPGKTGLEILRIMRQSQINTPVIILTAKEAIEDRITGLDSGADDYLTKPFDLQELSARIRALKRRANKRAEVVLTHDNIELNPAAHTVTLEGELVNINRREFTILQTLMERDGQVVSREQLTQILYGWGEEIDSNALEVHIYNLRKKLNTTDIRTIRGIGYMLKKSAHTSEV